MIAMSSSAKSFGTLADYLANGRSGEEPERVDWSASRNLPTADPELAGKIMRATAAQNVRVHDPVYHLALSFDPGDRVDRATMERVADRVLAALRLQGHQVLIVAHRDREHPHMHLLINRVHPDTGHVWNRWQDRTVLQQVLREEEQALGLRVVPGRLTPREQLPLDLDVDAQSLADRAPNRRETLPRDDPSRPAPVRLSRIDELSNHLRAWDRTAELTREGYHAEMETSAAKARAAQLEQALARAHRARETFEQALARVYRDPAAAQDNFRALVDATGLRDATRTVREHPEQLGPLVTVETRRAFGLATTVDDSAARRGAIDAALSGRDTIEAEHAAGVLVASAYLRRLERAQADEFVLWYQDPAAARAALEQLAAERGLPVTAAMVRARPEELGPLRTRDGPDLTARGPGIERIMTLGAEIAEARARETARSPARGGRADVELTATRTDVEHAVARQARLRQELRAIPDRGDLERRIVALLDRMSPRELRQLRTTLAPPHVSVVLKLKTALRDLLLGRDEGHQR